LTKLEPQKPAVDIIIGQMVYISSTTEKSFHPVLFLKVTDLMISNLNQYHPCAGLDAKFKAAIVNFSSSGKTQYMGFSGLVQICC